MNDFPFAIVGFDLDGTLVDTAGDITAALNHALGLAGRAPLSEAEVRPMIGLGTAHLLEQGLAATGGIPEGDSPRLYEALLAYYEANIAVHSRPFAGLVDALDPPPLGCDPTWLASSQQQMLRNHHVGQSD